ncbi:MAG TPA: hypothetical protein VMT46_18360 [Anaerolineaceae bacterium]|nr:hypothetical protein [Anaerolineaceae bacterium]
MASKRIFICADHGLAIVYFLQSAVAPTLIDQGIEVVLLTDDALREQITRRFGRPGLVVEGLRLKQARAYAEGHARDRQWWLAFLRRVGSSRRINTEAQDSYIRQVAVEEPNRRRLLMPAAWLTIAALRNSRAARRALVGIQQQFTPDLYGDLFQRYQPGLVIASTPGWRQDRYLLRQAAALGIPTAAAVVGWDNPSSYALPGAPVEWITCWSEMQKQELVEGSDWDPGLVHIGGIPSYDGYFCNEWVLPKEEYFRMHGLDPQRKLLAYACSFVSFSPNLRNVQALARLVSSGELAEPSQLLIRLHPNHFMPGSLFEKEREAMRQLTRVMPHVHMVEPVPLGGELGYYSGEDMPEKASMMVHADVFLTVYSTMMVEAAVNHSPIVSVCLDTPGGWNTPRKFSLPLSKIGDWPTHSRFRDTRAGRVALDEAALRDAVNLYLRDRNADRAEREALVRQEVTYTDGSAGRRTAGFILSILSGEGKKTA